MARIVKKLGSPVRTARPPTISPECAVNICTSPLPNAFSDKDSAAAERAAALVASAAASATRWETTKEPDKI